MAPLPPPEEQTPLLQHQYQDPQDSSSRTTSTASVPDEERNESKAESRKISRSRGAVIVGSIGMMIFLQATNISILTTTQSSIAADLDAFEQAVWFTSAYLIAMSSLAPLMGRLSQVFSPRLCMFFSTMVICLGCIITSLSNSFKSFIVGRVLTGAGGAGILIVAIIIVVQMTSPEKRGLYIGLANSGMTVGVSLGAVIAGALEPKIGWASSKPLFGIQAPLSLLAGFGLLAGIPANLAPMANDSEGTTLRKKLARVDYSGAILLIALIVLFLLGLSGPTILATPLILSALALPAFILNEMYIAKDPVIPITVLRSRGTLLSCLATVGFMMARWGVLFYTPVYALAVRGWKPAVAGSILIPTNAGFAIGGLLAGVFHIRRNGSFYMHSVVSMMLFPLTLLVLVFISTPDSSWGLYVLMVFCNGALAGAGLNYTLVHLLHLTVPEVHPIVLSLLATFRGFAGSFGSAIGGGLFERVLHKSLVNGFADAGLGDRSSLIRTLLGSPATVGTLDGEEKEVAVNAYEDAVKALFLGAVCLSVIVAMVQAGTGWTAPAKRYEQLAEDEEVEGEVGIFGGS
ncbi:MFS general substrate transporter [Byssothecium circinans]|uniref:MFS general substrate transporter n=1 Tax=Byssothecium circinans TaxID=147558 RepID=A0A6A5TPC0_9PLEO|nr:MFS general substrate transporter [Byssothecium circinans]